MSGPQNVGQTGNADNVSQQDPDAQLKSDFDQIVQMIADEFTEDVDESTKKEKDKKSEKSKTGDDFSKAGNFGLLVSQFQQKMQTKTEWLKNYGPPGLPQLRGALSNLNDVSSGSSGYGNPWLKGSLMTDIFMIMFEIMPILMKIKMSEALQEAEKILQAQKMAESQAEAARDVKEAQAKQMQLDAIKQFVSAGISFAMMGAQLASSAQSEVKGKLNAGMSKLKTGAGMGFRGAKMVGTTGWNKLKSSQRFGVRNEQNEATGDLKIGNRQFNLQSLRNASSHLKDLRAQKEMAAAQLKGERHYSKDYIDPNKGEKPFKNFSTRDLAKMRRQERSKTRDARERESMNTKKQQEAARMQMRSQQLSQMSQALQGIAGGAIDFLKAEAKLEEGEAEYLQTLFSNMLNVANEAKKSAQSARQEAAETLTGLLRQLDQLIQQTSQAFAIKRGQQ